MSDGPGTTDSGSSQPSSAEATSPTPNSPESTSTPTSSTPTSSTPTSPPAGTNAGTNAGKPDITCNRCGIVTTWTPYCPGCNAYLEFAGTPPWTPDVVTSTLPGESKAPTPADVDGSADSKATTVIAAAAGGAVAAAAIAPEDRSLVEMVKDDYRAAEEMLEDAYDHLFDKDRTDDQANDESDDDPGKGMRPLKARRARKAAAAAAAATEPAQEGVVFENPHVIQAPAITEPSAASPSDTYVAEQRTRAVDVEDENADGQVCPRCHLRNPAGRSYCEWCGTAMPGMTLAPVSDAYNPLDPDGGSKANSKPYRSPWLRNTIILTCVALFAYGIYWVFWGPGAQSSYLLFKVTAQRVTEFIDPTSGEAAPIKSITASSTLQSTSTDNLSAVQSRNFWASAPMSLYGAGTTITFEFTEESQIDRLLIYPGIQNNQLDVDALATPQEITLELTPGNFFTTTLGEVAASSNWQQVVNFPVVNTSKVIMRINSVYPPRYPDAAGSTVGSVAISSVQFLEVPSRTTITLPTSVPTVPTSVPTSVPTTVPTP